MYYNLVPKGAHGTKRVKYGLKLKLSDSLGAGKLNYRMQGTISKLLVMGARR
jgi:hypothetical protein